MEMDHASYLTNLSNTLFEFSKANILCDTTLIARNAEFTAHSAILAAASPTLRSAFGNPVAERNMYRIELLETDGATVESVLFLIYTGNLKPLEDADMTKEASASFITTCEQLGLDWMWSQLDLPLKRQHSPSRMLDEAQGSSMRSDDKAKHTDAIQLPSDTDQIKQNNAESSGDCTIFDTAIVKDEISYTACEQVSVSQEENTFCEKQQFVCDLCNKIFISGDLLKSHRAHHLTKSPLTCPDCGCQFKYAGALRRHSEIHKVTDSGTVCHICGVVCTRPSELKSHLTVAHGEDKEQLEHRRKFSLPDFVCSQCQKSFCEKSQLKKHLLVHDPGKKFVCEICSRGFSQEYYLKKHQRTHSSTLDHVCPTCGKQFKLLDYLKVHMKSHSAAGNDDPQKVHQCNVCSETFSHPSYLKKHARSHVGEKLYECETCGKRFKVNCIQQHMLTHSKERPYACDKCTRRFTRHADLQSHLETHYGTKTHCCPLCIRRFHKKGDLQRHMRIHTGERPYICETCGKSFKILFHLRLHSYVHSTDRPHKCNTCGKAFSSSVRLKKHEFIHSGLRPYACPICFRRFNRQANMRSHLKTHSHKTTKAGDVKTIENGLEMTIEPDGRQHAEGLMGPENVEIVYCKLEQPDVLLALPLDSHQNYKL